VKFAPNKAIDGDRSIGSEEAKMASVCPQNRAYGSVHGSSRKPYPLTKIKPVRELFVRTNDLSHLVNKPTIRIRFRNREAIGKRPAFIIREYRLCSRPA
jgi:hypothetical protein